MKIKIASGLILAVSFRLSHNISVGDCFFPFEGSSAIYKANYACGLLQGGEDPSLRYQ